MRLNMIAAAVSNRPRLAPYTPPEEGGGTSILLLGTDFVSTPTSGGEDNLGGYVRLYFYGDVVFSDLGSSIKVKIGGAEVANYRFLRQLPGTTGTGLSYIKEIAVQVGALGGAAYGTAIPFDITDGGGPSLLLNSSSGGFFQDLSGQDLAFTPNQGAIKFIAQDGDDADAGTIGEPLRHLQYGTGSGDIIGFLFMSGGYNGSTTGNTCPPGSYGVLREGSGGAAWTDYMSAYSGSYGARWAALTLITGTTPTSSSNTGPICITAYPGPAGANTPEDVYWAGPAEAVGGIHGSDNTKSDPGVTTVWGTAGYGKHIHISGLRIEVHADCQAADAAPINLQNRADGWRVIGNDLMWQADPSIPDAQAAGIANGGANTVKRFNYIHDIHGTSAMENHGIYEGDYANQDCSFNVIKNILDGSGMMMRGDSVDGATNFKWHHNWIENAGRCGMNLVESTATGAIWANILINSGYRYADSAIRFNTDSTVMGSNGIKVYYNTVDGWNTYAIRNHGNPTGNIDAKYNVFRQRSGHAGSGYMADAFGALSVSTNCWYNATSGATKPTEDSTGLTADPLFTDLAGKDYLPQSGSPCLNAAETSLSLANTGRDFAMVTRPQRSKSSIGAFERAA